MSLQGDYTVVVTATYNCDISATAQFTLHIYDCETMDLSDTPFASGVTYNIAYTAQLISWSKSNDCTYNPKCGDVSFEVFMDNVAEDPIDASIFTTQLTEPTHSLSIATSDYSKVGTYTVKIWMFY